MRWNYLPVFERHLTPPHYTPDALLLGTDTVARRYRQALNAAATAPHPQTV
ncbi:hypothetical protein ACFZDK_49205 [Streptomyces sp. NPDC007901]|uniref:hypothetical protein n=1 Tax=Streptomyces sp. NPDC007901 TaxID=3364785 RepID=UPI0036E02CAE